MFDLLDYVVDDDPEFSAKRVALFATLMTTLCAALLPPGEREEVRDENGAVEVLKGDARVIRYASAMAAEIVMEAELFELASMGAAFEAYADDIDEAVEVAAAEKDGSTIQ